MLIIAKRGIKLYIYFNLGGIKEKECKEQQWANKSVKQAEITEVLIVLKEITIKILENSEGDGSWWLEH